MELTLTPQQQTFFNVIKDWHGSQKRKYTFEPYWHHLWRVAERVAHLGDVLVEAALAHDVLEDTPCTPADLREVLDSLPYEEVEADKIVRLIIELTDVFTKEHYPKINRWERKKKEAARLWQISPEAQTIKYADLADNATSIMQNDPGFGHIYLREKKLILSEMHEGDEQLRKVCYEILKKNGL